MRLTLLGVGAMQSPRYAPAGLLVEGGGARVALDGGPDAAVGGELDAWLLTDDRAELGPAIRRRARALGLRAGVAKFTGRGVELEPVPVVHTSHPAFGYMISVDGRTVAWAPEFWEFPRWAAGVSLMFAEGSSWERPIRFAGGVGGHAPVLETARLAREYGMRRLVFAHLGRSTIRALDAGNLPPYGEVGEDGASYRPHGAGWALERPQSAE